MTLYLLIGLTLFAYDNWQLGPGPFQERTEIAIIYMGGWPILLPVSMMLAFYSNTLDKR